jgi:hypothetical protein
VLMQINTGRGEPTGLVVVPGLAVARLLRLCDPEPPLLLAADVDAAAITLLGHPRSAMQLVSDAPYQPALHQLRGASRLDGRAGLEPATRGYVYLGIGRCRTTCNNVARQLD